MEFTEKSPSLASPPPQGPIDPPSPVEKTGMMVKLGWKKTVLGGDSWQPRFFRLTATSISYAKDSESPIIDDIVFHKAVECKIVDAGTLARRNRYENNDNGKARATSATSGPIGKDNCVEMLVPYEIGKINNFNGSPWARLKQMQGRTYYFHCSSRKEAEEWKAAIMNNVRTLPGARLAGFATARMLGTGVDNGSMDPEEFKAAFIQQYVTFFTEVSDRVMRTLVRVKKVELTAEEQAAMQQQILNELNQLRGTVLINKPDRKAILFGKLTDTLVEQVLLMIDDERNLPAGEITKAASALFKVHHAEDSVQLRANAMAQAHANIAAMRGGAAMMGGAAAAAAAQRGGNKSSFAGEMAGAAGEAAGGRAADAAIDVITGFIPLPFAGAVIGAGIKHIVKKTAQAAVSEKK